MAADVAMDAGAAAVAVEAVPPPSETTKQLHRLGRKWTFWFDNQSKPKQGAAWGTSLRKVYTFDTVEEFWCLYDQIFKPSKLPGNADFHRFKADAEPKWEDPECANGVRRSVALLQVCARRKTNCHYATNEAVQMSIGRKWKEIIDVADKINYSFHDDSRKERSANG